jgi:hypothetical protein
MINNRIDTREKEGAALEVGFRSRYFIRVY